MKADDGRKARIRKRARGHLHVGNFDIVGGVLLAESNGMDGNPLAADFRDRFEIDAAGIVGAVAHQHHGADGQAGGVGHHLFQRIADVGGGDGRGELVRACRSDPGGRPADKDELEIYLLNH